MLAAHRPHGLSSARSGVRSGVIKAVWALWEPKADSKTAETI
jgi:hypothetical protein